MFQLLASTMMIRLLLASSAAAAELPDPFVFADGHRVKSAADWTARRAELQELILQNEYGHLPPPPKSMTSIELLSHRLKTPKAMHRQFKIICDPGEGREKVSFVLDLMIPDGETAHAVILRGDWCWGKLNDEIAIRD